MIARGVLYETGAGRQKSAIQQMLDSAASANRYFVEDS
jgi:hypothetical protein